MLRAIKIIHSWNQIKEYRFLSDYFRMINIHTANLRPTNFRESLFFRAGNSSNRVNAFHICVYVHRCAVPRYIALQHP